jgi:hypothetical protein
MDARPLARRVALRQNRWTMDPAHARALAEMVHAEDRDEHGTRTLPHVRRVAQIVPAEARAVAWLHEALDSTAVTEEELLMEGLTTDELRALRLLHLTSHARSDRVYLAHLELIGRAAGRSGRLARMVKIADLADRCLHPRVRPDGWSPPYAERLDFLLNVSVDRVTDAWAVAEPGPATRA